MNKRSLIKTVIIFIGFLLAVQLYINVSNERAFLILESANEYDDFTTINQFKKKCLLKQDLIRKQIDDYCTKAKVSYYILSKTISFPILRV